MTLDRSDPEGAITVEHLRRTIESHGVVVGRGDLVRVRTGRSTRARREGWGDYAGGASPGLSFTTADWLHGTEIAGIATRWRTTAPPTACTSSSPPPRPSR